MGPMRNVCYGTSNTCTKVPYGHSYQSYMAKHWYVIAQWDKAAKQMFSYQNAFANYSEEEAKDIKDDKPKGW